MINVPGALQDRKLNNFQATSALMVDGTEDVA
jgi:hypothetical protein